MASPSNPLLSGGDPSASQAGAGLASTVMGALAGRSQGQSAGQDFSQQSAALQGADPTMILRQLEQINQLLGVLFVKTFQSMPNLANQISATMKQLSRALKEGGQASNVGEAIKGNRDAQAQGSQPPITFSAAMQGDNAQPASSGVSS